MEIRRIRATAGLRKITTAAAALLIVLISWPGRGEAEDAVLVIRRGGASFGEAASGLKSELKGELKVVDHVISRKCDRDHLKILVREIKPKCIVLMDNVAISRFREYRMSLGKDEPVVPAVAFMSVMVEKSTEGLDNIYGIAYEIPVVTSVVSLRSILGITINRVGVIHREFLSGFIEKNSEYCEMEGIQIVNISIPDKKKSLKPVIKKGLKSLVKEKSAEALWIPNDNALLTPEIIKSIWIPAVRRFRMPVVVGVEVLVNPELNFGTFAVLPDHVSLGVQAAELVFEIMENGWQCNGRRVDPPLAVHKILNYRQVKNKYGVSVKRFKNIDKILK